jgi:uncharacterized Zn finger protein (UPF0148 family)
MLQNGQQIRWEKMGSVQSEITCDKCKYPQAFEDYYYKSGEVYVFCPRCGYCFSAFIKLDPAYGRQRKAQAEALIKEGKIEEALKVSANTGWVSHRDGKDVPIAEWSDEEKIRTIKDTSWDRFYKKDEEGELVWDVKKSGGFGAYMHRGKRGIGRGGQFTNKWSAKSAIKKMIRYMKKAPAHESITYTKKICGKWYEFDARTGKKELMEGEIHE